MLDATVVVLATWTVVYHACVVLRIETTWAVVGELLVLAAAAATAWTLHRRSAPDPVDPAEEPAVESGQEPAEDPARRPASRAELALLVVTVLAGTAATTLLALTSPWRWVAWTWLLTAVAGTAWAGMRLSRSGRDEVTADSTGERRLNAVVALAWALGLAVFSLVTLRPSPDDLYYVNLAQWVTEHGTFPLRDTIFSDLVYPMSSWPPMASYEPLAGTVARLLGTSAGSVVFVVVPPIATFLSVLALWRLLDAWRVRPLALALSLGLVFLLLDGGGSTATPGNLFVTRLWQGKVILLCLLIPVLLVYALRYVDRPTWARAGWLFAGGVAAVGLSTSGMFLVPLLAVAGAAPLVFRAPLRAAYGFLAMSAYPLGAGLVTVAVGGRSADQFGTRELQRFNPGWFGHHIFHEGLLAVVAVAAVLAGALLVPRRPARVTTGLLVLATGVTFVPGVTEWAFDLVGLGPTLWRVSWLATVGALVGVVGAWTWSLPSTPLLRPVGSVAMVAVLAVVGTPIWSETSGTTLVAPPHWQRPEATMVAATRLVDQLPDGAVVLAPQELAITVDVMTTRVKTVAPRDYFMDYLRDDPSFHYAERLALVDFANGVRRWSGPPPVPDALRVLDVDAVCLLSDWTDRLDQLRGLGYERAVATEVYTCLRR